MEADKFMFMLCAVAVKLIICAAEECPQVGQFKNALEVCITCADLSCTQPGIDECEDHHCPVLTPPPPPTPPNPTNMSVTVVKYSEDCITIEWEQVKESQEYSCMIVDKDSASVPHWQSTELNNTTFFGLTPGRCYDIEVNATGCNAHGTVRQRTKPQAPSNITASIEAESMTVEWTPAAGDVDGYYVKYECQGGPDYPILRVPASPNPSVCLTNLQPHTEYTITVITFSGRGEDETTSSAYTRATTAMLVEAGDKPVLSDPQQPTESGASKFQDAVVILAGLILLTLACLLTYHCARSPPHVHEVHNQITYNFHIYHV